MVLIPGYHLETWQWIDRYMRHRNNGRIGHLFCVLKNGSLCIQTTGGGKSVLIGGAGKRGNNCRMGMKMEAAVQSKTCGKGKKCYLFLLNCREETG